MPDNNFFPPRDEREICQFVIDEFPFPIAVAYARLHRWMDDQEPVAAAWQLRDTLECVLKFCTSLAVADFLQHRREAEDKETHKLLAQLLEPRGLSLGHWQQLLRTALQTKNSANRHLPRLSEVFHKSTGLENLAQWRNDVFGHGVFKQERSWYANEVAEWLPRLNALCRRLQPVWKGWELRGDTPGDTPGGGAVVWMGAGQIHPVALHRHKAWGQPLPMSFVNGDVTLSLSALLSVQKCDLCSQVAAFFFEGNEYKRKNNLHKTNFLEYFEGHSRNEKNWPEVRRLYDLLPTDYKWERIGWDGHAIAEGIELAFQDFETQYMRPAYLMDRFWQVVDNTEQQEKPRKGYIHLTASSGIGKTYFVRGLENKEQRPDAPVLAYYIQPGATTNYQTFVIELIDIIQRHPNRLYKVDPVQVAVSSHEDLREQFAGFLTTLMDVNSLSTLVVAIDALDELADPAADSAAITSLLPSPDQLPEGCFILLTSRERLRPQISRDVERLKTADGGLFTELSVKPGDAGNEAMLRAYFQANLPESLRTPANIEKAVSRSGGTLLYAFHFCRALEAEAFRDVDDLPQGKEFYPVYLGRLRDRVGDVLYELIYLPTLLLLTAARRPVTLGQLQDWGIPRERLEFALLDLRDFLQVHRTLSFHERAGEDDGENRYEMAHEAFVRYVQGDETLSVQLREAHARIMHHAWSKHQGKWDELDGEDDVELYRLMYLRQHRDLAGLSEPEDVRLYEDGHTDAAVKFADLLLEKSKYYLVLYLYEEIITFFKLLVLDKGNQELAHDLVKALNRKGRALWELGHLPAAVANHEDAIAILNHLILDVGRDDLLNNLARTFNNMGLALWSLGHFSVALPYYDKAIVIHQQIVDEGRDDIANELATALMNRGNVLCHLGQISAGIQNHDKAIMILRPLIDAGRRDLANDLAKVLINRGNALCDRGQLAEGVLNYSEAIEIRRHLMSEGCPNLANALANALMNRGEALCDLAQFSEGIINLDEAIAIYRRIVVAEDRQELADGLALALMNKGIALNSLGDSLTALPIYNEAITIYRKLMQDGNRQDLSGNLAAALMNKGFALCALDQLSTALITYNESIAIYRHLFETEGREMLFDDFVSVFNNKIDTLRILGQKKLTVETAQELVSFVRIAFEKDGSQHLPLLFGVQNTYFQVLHENDDWTGTARVVKDVCQILSQDDLSPTKEAVQTVHDLLQIIESLPSSQREQLVAALGANAEELFDVMKKFGEES